MKKLGFQRLFTILSKDADSAIIELTHYKADFYELVSGDNIRRDLLILLVQIIGEKICNQDASIDTLRNALLVKICNEKFLSQLKKLGLEFLEKSCIKPAKKW